MKRPKILQKCKQTNDQSFSHELLQALNKNRCDNWKRITEKVNFTHSSRKAWSILKKLGAAPFIKSVRPTIGANKIASRCLFLNEGRNGKMNHH